MFAIYLLNLAQEEIITNASIASRNFFHLTLTHQQVQH